MLQYTTVSGVTLFTTFCGSKHSLRDERDKEVGGVHDKRGKKAHLLIPVQASTRDLMCLV